MKISQRLKGIAAKFICTTLAAFLLFGGYVSTKKEFMFSKHVENALFLIKKDKSDIKVRLDNIDYLKEAMPRKLEYLFSHPLETLIYNEELNRINSTSLDDLLAGLNKQTFSYKKPYSESSSTGLVYPFPDGTPQELKLGVWTILQGINKAEALRKNAFSKLSDGELKYLKENAIEFMQYDTKFNSSHKNILKYTEIARKVDLEGLYQAALVLTRAVESGKKHLLKVKNFVPFESYSFTGLPVAVGGRGIDVYNREYLLTVDFGGNDSYRNKAGGAFDGISVVVDFDGNDSYESEDFSQGAGVFGIGILEDLAGDNKYSARFYSQGCGFLGIGILKSGSGNDVYRGDTFIQGAGAFGYGVLNDKNGDDNFSAHLFAQGFGSVLGAGLLFEEDGNDRYFAWGKYPDIYRDKTRNGSLAQGFGLGWRNEKFKEDKLKHIPGGFGFLLDRNGDDRYKADIFGQGCSSWQAFGLLNDSRGNDVYIVDNYGQGAGIHRAIGVVIDKKGNDAYYGSYHSQGHGLDNSIGILADYSGGDCYFGVGDTQGIGVKPLGIGILTDFSGDDNYYARGGQGNSRPLEDEALWPIGILINIGGKDFYSTKNQKDPKKYIITNKQGILIDWD